ncbi:MAG: VWA domain-containing protein [Deltaproteobacteria bacterium]|nr:VWA domain-containing protein [Deltaproteobacteria bacterium]
MTPTRPPPEDDAGNADRERRGRFDLCVELERSGPTSLSVTFVTRITTADVLFLVDTTGSMGTEIANIQQSLRETLIPGIAAAIPNVHFAVASFADFPTEPYGAALDLPFVLHQPSTDEVFWVQRAVDELPTSNGNDEPESLVEAVYQAATGDGIPGLVPHGPLCPDDGVGYPCFRATGARIFLVFTDAPSHNGPDGASRYRDLREEPHTYDAALAALSAIGAKVIGLNSGSPEDGAHVTRLARDTGAIDGAGAAIVRDIGFDGDSLDVDVVDAVRALVDDVPIDVELALEDVGGDEIDATALVGAVSLESVVPESGYAGADGARALDVRPGTRVTFRLELDARALGRDDADRAYHLRVVLVADGTTPLEERVVRIVVPGRRRTLRCEPP